MNIAVAVVSDNCDGNDFVALSRSSIALTGRTTDVCSPGDAWDTVRDAEYSHIIAGGTILHPSFYEAMVNGCEHAKADYACCPCASLAGADGPVVTVPGQGGLVWGQILVRSWVLRELGKSGSPGKLLNRVIKEYRGQSVPHVLCTELVV